MQFQENEGDGSFSSSSSMEDCPGSHLGLTLRKTPSFIDLLETKLTEARQQEIMNNFIALPMQPEKLKASNFPVSQLIIGSWKRVSNNEGDLIGKLYYAKRKLVWEVLDRGLKSKIEVQWSDISAIKDHANDDGIQILEIQLNQPPSFFRENEPQPRKHTIWQPSQDFTEGQASICRKHIVYFPPGAFDRHFEKLLQYDRRLYDLSRKHFPSQDHPYFHQNPYGFSDFPSGINGYLPEFSHAQHNYPVQNFPPATILPSHPSNFKQNTHSPMSVMDSLFPDEGGSSYVYENQWGDQRVKNPFQDSASMATIQENHIPQNENQWGDQSANNHFQDSISMTAIQDTNIHQNYNLNYGEELLGGMNNPNNIQNHLGETQATDLDEMGALASFNSMYPELDLQQAEANTIQCLPPQQVSYDDMNINSSLNYTSMYQHAPPEHQVSNEGMDVNSLLNTSTYQYAPPQQGMNVNSSMNQYAPRPQVSGMNVNSSLKESLYPYGMPEPAMEDMIAMDAQQNTHHWN